jgi:GTP-binding protein EngB required for normal cell division
MDTVRLFAQLGDIAKQIDAHEIESDALALRLRLGEGRWYLACVGQSKRGKSSLINALIGQPILPTGVTPVTSVVTIVRYGREPAASVRFNDGHTRRIDVSELEGYVSEGSNSGNAKGVVAVDVCVPASLLAGGVCLVDTPGIGSVFFENTEATRAFLPRVDAALLVLAGDPPISADELTLIESVASDVAELVVVLNKADRVARADFAEVRAFTASVLRERLTRAVDPIYEVSATERLSGMITRDWRKLEEHLRSLADRTAAVSTRSAVRQGRRLVRLVRREVEEAQAALLRPLEESERRISGLDASVAGAERALRDMSALMSAEQVSLTRSLDEAEGTFVREALERFNSLLQPRLAPALNGQRADLRTSAFQVASETAREVIEAWAWKLEPEIEAMHRDVTTRFVALANQFFMQLCGSGDPSFERLPSRLEPDDKLREPPHFYFTSLMHLTGAGPFHWIRNRVRSRATFVESVRREAGAYGERLVRSNASRVAHDLEDRVSASRRELEKELRLRLTVMTASARRALDRARERRQAGASAVERELARLRTLAASLNDIEGEVEQRSAQR